jgi:guanylate kinase
MDKKEKVIILGKSGSGKDFLLRRLGEKAMKPCLKTTTRPKRKFEEQGVNYLFVSNDEFQAKISNNEFLVYESFLVTPENSEQQTWFYGITNEQFELCNVAIMTPNELSKINKDQRKGCFIVYLDISREVREKRILKREDKNDSIKRRLDNDEIDFQGFSDYDLRITDPDFSADEVYDLTE